METNDKAREAIRALGGMAREVAELPGGWLPLWEWVGLLGMTPADLPRVAEWVRAGEIEVAVHAGVVYLPRPAWGSPPPGFVTVRQFAASREVSGSHVYNLIATGRLGPVWQSPVRVYSHYYVAEWADLDSPKRKAA